ncbi:hypothetical protein CVT24_011728 [Panaeolus cyanescens]|uniref:Uncharacterized protein n=1 Tax=Panaeolus cyanescens TaxID=181874 RepID=A0A409WQ71_9AGAR|nr:hypothetical protein CVT24_011728 [Panaeolus cyanescens]
MPKSKLKSKEYISSEDELDEILSSSCSANSSDDEETASHKSIQFISLNSGYSKEFNDFSPPPGILMDAEEPVNLEPSPKPTDKPAKKRKQVINHNKQENGDRAGKKSKKRRLHSNTNTVEKDDVMSMESVPTPDCPLVALKYNLSLFYASESRKDLKKHTGRIHL